MRTGRGTVTGLDGGGIIATHIKSGLGEASSDYDVIPTLEMRRFTGCLLLQRGFHFFNSSSTHYLGYCWLLRNEAMTQLQSFGSNAPCINLELAASRVCCSTV
jgi:hypothetical protein